MGPSVPFVAATAANPASVARSRSRSPLSVERQASWAWRTSMHRQSRYQDRAAIPGALAQAGQSCIRLRLIEADR